MVALSEVLRAKRDEIIERWLERIVAQGITGSIDRDLLIDSLREYIDQLAAVLDAKSNTRDDGAEPAVSIATVHGGQRFHLGFDMGAVIREYGLLRETLFDVVEESGHAFSTDEYRCVARFLIRGIADAATHYAAERDHELRRQTARHFGFLAHELRNPLSSLGLTLTLMKEQGELPASRRVERIEQNIVRMRELIDSTLRQARLDTTPEPSVESFDLMDLLESVADESTTEAEARGVRILVSGQPQLPVSADPKLLRSALSNLIRNAVKFTKDGGEIHVRAKQTSEKGVVAEVEDECGGIPDELVKKLFDPFVQVGTDRSGFGLGLAIAKQACEAHGGSIRVHSIPEKGCVFVLDLPRVPSPPSA